MGNEANKQPEIIDAEFEEQARPSGPVADVIREVADVVDVVTKPLKRISPETARKVQVGTNAARSIGDKVDDIVDKSKAIYARAKEVSAKVEETMHKVRPTSVISRKF